MKSRTFSGDGPAAIIKAVNDWLAGETGITIRDTQTRTEAADPVTGIAPTTFEVWYEEDSRTS